MLNEEELQKALAGHALKTESGAKVEKFRKVLTTISSFFKYKALIDGELEYFTCDGRFDLYTTNSALDLCLDYEAEAKKNLTMENKELWTYKGNTYTIRDKSKVKSNGVWKDCIIYECQYDNQDGKIWVREAEEFYKLFKNVRNTISIEEYSKKALEYTDMTGDKLLEYSYLGMLEEIGEFSGKLAKQIRGDYVILEDDLISTHDKYINHKDLMLELGDIMWMLNAHTQFYRENIKVSVDIAEYKSICGISIIEELYNLNYHFSNINWFRMFSVLISIANHYGYTIEEVMYLNIEKLEGRKLRNTIKGNGDVR